MWHVQALQTSGAQPSFGPVTPRMSRSTHRRRTLSSASTVICSPLRMKVCVGMDGDSFVQDALKGAVEAVRRRLRGVRLEGQRREARRVVVDREPGRQGAGGTGI